jgi:hypothetical protein
LLETGVETTIGADGIRKNAGGADGNGGTQHTAQHRPSQERSVPPFGESPLDLVTVPARQGLEAVDILRRGAAPAVGPVLHDDSGDTLGFLVPPGTAEDWDLPGSACTRTLGPGLCTGARTDEGAAHPQPPEPPPVDGAGWLLPPDTAGPVTDPAVLREALGEAARLIEAADRRR